MHDKPIGLQSGCEQYRIYYKLPSIRHKIKISTVHWRFSYFFSFLPFIKYLSWIMITQAHWCKHGKSWCNSPWRVKTSRWQEILCWKCIIQKEKKKPKKGKNVIKMKNVRGNTAGAGNQSRWMKDFEKYQMSLNSMLAPTHKYALGGCHDATYCLNQWKFACLTDCKYMHIYFICILAAVYTHKYIGMYICLNFAQWRVAAWCVRHVIYNCCAAGRTFP